MSIYADPLFVAAEVEHRLELAGVHRDGRHPPVPVAAHPLSGFVARAVAGLRGRRSDRPVGRALDGSRPRHP
ncbi:MAG: hypothetical protein ACRCY8_12370 [Dermatophilaceae bacterium]